MKKNIFTLLIFAFVVVLFSCKKNNEKQISEVIENPPVRELSEEEKQDLKLKEYIKTLSLTQKIPQLFIVNLDGNQKFRVFEKVSDFAGNSSVLVQNSLSTESLDDELPAENFENEKPLVAGGYLFFSYNLADTTQETSAFIKSIHDFCDENKIIQPFLAIDQEGGVVNRLKNLMGPFPSQERMANNYTLQQASELYADEALKMKNLGFHLNLAPVVEICTEENKDFLSGRSFGNAQKTLEYSSVCVNAYENNGIGCVIKHFPGNTNTDPHTGLPVIKTDYENLMQSLEPFREVIKLNPAGVLMSHAITTCLDDGVPSCLSYKWVSEVLQNNFGFEGIIFSDDIFMSALADNGYPPDVAAVKAIEAGINCIMISEKRFSKPAKLIYEKALEDSDFEEKINESVFKILKFKILKGLFTLYETE